MFRLRDAKIEDLPDIVELAGILNTVNLPPQSDYLRELIESSQRAFSGGSDPSLFDPERHFLFVLEDPKGQVVGTSALHAQHGTPASPHTFFRVREDERLSLLDPSVQVNPVHKRHVVLTLGQTFDGPTEVGGLVLHPRLRGQPGKLGTMLSYGRFVYIACKRNWFREQLLAEVLPPLGVDEKGVPTSELWDALGGRLTGLDYDAADKLSRTDKNFIWRLFPHTPIYACLFSQAAQDVIGEVADKSKGAARLLEKIGFEISDDIDPFDGGPHFYADTDAIRPSQEGMWASVYPVQDFDAPFGMVAVCRPGSPCFRMVRTPVRVHNDEAVAYLQPEAIARLGLEASELSDPRAVFVWPSHA